MSCPFSNDPDDKDRGWLSRCQVVAVVVFLTLFAGLVVWTTVAMPAPVADIEWKFLLPAFASSELANSSDGGEREAP